jgi:hypothetical protein
MKRLVTSALLSLALLTGASRSVADDEAGLRRDLSTGSDYRLRVAAALALGKISSATSRKALEQGLSDAHVAVRAAAAAALAAQQHDDKARTSVLASLKAARARESNDSVKSQIDTAIQRLVAKSVKTRFLVTLGRVENKSSDKDGKLVSLLRERTKAQMNLVPGVEVLADGADPLTTAKSRGLPAFTFDASLTLLAKDQSREGVGFAAKVEYLIRRDQTLKGTVTGSARALTDARVAGKPSELAQLQADAIGAAVESALKGAETALDAAAKK